MKENRKIFNRFEWNKIIVKSPEELKEKFPVKKLIGKKIKALNAIGLFHDFCMECILLKDIDEKFIQENEKGHSIIQNEPFVFVFEDDSTFELQLMWEKEYYFSQNQISPDITDGMNHCEIDTNIFFEKIIGSKITDIKLDKNITFFTDSEFSLKIEFYDTNQSMISLMKNNQYTEIDSKLYFSAKKNVNQIPIEEGHNTSSFFWIMPVNELDSKEKGYFGVEEETNAEFSIEEDYIINYLKEFLLKHFDSSLYKVCRNPEDGIPEFEWNLEWNFYEYKTVKKIIEEIKELCHLLKTDYKNEKTLWFRTRNCKFFLPSNQEKLRNYKGTDSSVILEDKMTDEEINTAIDFYNRFIFQMEQMMKYYPNHQFINFMGP